MKVLFSFEARYLDFGSSGMLSPHHYCMIGAYDAHYGDQSRVCHWRDPEKQNDLVKQVCWFKPDLVVAGPTLQSDDPASMYGYIRDELKVPVIMVWLESAPDVVRFGDIYAPETTATVYVDTAEHWRKFTKYPDKCHWLLEPKDPRIFHGHGIEPRDIPVTFIGSLLGRSDRAFNLANCWANRIDVRKVGGIDGHALSLDGYAGYLRRSQITLNFTSAITFQHVNGRCSEAAMCGALLMESASQETMRFFEPGVHYVPFVEDFHIDESSGALRYQQGDLVDKLRYYMGPGADEARRIAERGQELAMKLFDGRQFWERMFALAGIDGRL